MLQQCPSSQGSVAPADGRATDSAIKAIKEQLLAIPDHGMGYGMLRYLNADTAPLLAARSLPQISFN